MTTNPPTIGPHSRIVGQNARAFRRFNGWSMNFLVDRLAEVNRPMHMGSLQRLEVGNRRVDVDDLVALAAALSVTTEQLLDSSKGEYGLVGTYCTPLDDDEEEL